MKELHRLTEQQIGLLDPIWRNGEATVREVHAAQAETQGLALKTVGTVLRRLEHQGILEHRVEGRQFVYRPLVTRDEVRTAVLDAAAQSLFSGSLAALVDHARQLNGGGR
jgi:predicted transcriptional regulator